jgi:hypothetical protein
MMKVDGIGKEEKLKIERRRVVKVERKKRRRKKFMFPISIRRCRRLL